MWKELLVIRILSYYGEYPDCFALVAHHALYYPMFSYFIYYEMMQSWKYSYLDKIHHAWLSIPVGRRDQFIPLWRDAELVLPTIYLVPVLTTLAERAGKTFPLDI